MSLNQLPPLFRIANFLPCRLVFASDEKFTKAAYTILGEISSSEECRTYRALAHCGLADELHDVVIKVCDPADPVFLNPVRDETDEIQHDLIILEASWCHLVIRPWIPGRSLDKLPKKKSYAKPFLRACAKLHLSRESLDIKPSNLVVRPNGKICIIDIPIHKCWTTKYASDEILVDGVSHGTRSDLPAIGEVLEFLYDHKIPNHFSKLIHATKSKNQRPTAQQLLDHLEQRSYKKKVFSAIFAIVFALGFSLTGRSSNEVLNQNIVEVFTGAPSYQKDAYIETYQKRYLIGDSVLSDTPEGLKTGKIIEINSAYFVFKSGEKKYNIGYKPFFLFGAQLLPNQANLIVYPGSKRKIVGAFSVISKAAIQEIPDLSISWGNGTRKGAVDGAIVRKEMAELFGINLSQSFDDKTIPDGFQPKDLGKFKEK